MKNKKLKIAIPIFTLVIAIAVAWAIHSSFAVPTNNSISISCGTTTLNAGEGTDCTIKGSSNGLTGVNFNWSKTSGISISNMAKKGDWNTDMIQGNFVSLTSLYAKNSSFDIASFRLTAGASSAGTSQTFTLYNIEYTGDGEAALSNKSLNITVKAKPSPSPSPSPTKTPTPAVKSSNNYLSSLSLSQGKIAFSKTKTNYSVTVGATVSSVKINAKLEHGKASYVAGYNPRTVNLKYGKNTVYIKTVAENGAKRTYTINITRSKTSSGGSSTKKSSSKSGSSNKTSKTASKSSDNKLKTLYLSDGVIKFKSNKYAYDVEVPYSVKKITVKGETSNDKAKVDGFGKHDLSVGANTIKVVVTAENGDEKTYTLRITRKEQSKSKQELDSNNYLKDLSIVGYEFDFDKNKEVYDIDRGGKESLEIKAYTESDTAKVTIQGNERLTDKSEIQVIVTAEDGSNRTYTIVVHDSNDLMFTAIGIFLIGLLSIIVVVLYKSRKANKE